MKKSIALIIGIFSLSLLSLQANTTPSEATYQLGNTTTLKLVTNADGSITIKQFESVGGGGHQCINEKDIVLQQVGSNRVYLSTETTNTVLIFGKDIFGKFVRMATSQNWYNPAGNESKVYSCGMRAVMPDETMRLYLKK